MVGIIDFEGDIADELCNQHDDNLAEVLDDDDCASMALTLADFQADRESRSTGHEPTLKA